MLPGGRFARLSDLADVKDGVAEIRSLARLNGRPATMFSVFKSKGSSDVNVLAAAQRELAKIEKENPQVVVSQAYTSVDYTKGTYHSAMEALVEGSILAVLVVFLFLRNVRATLIAALAIPLSAIPAFAFMLPSAPPTMSASPQASRPCTRASRRRIHTIRAALTPSASSTKSQRCQPDASARKLNAAPVL